MAPIPGHQAHVRVGVRRGSLGLETRGILRNMTTASAIALLLGLLLSWTVARAVTSEAERAQRAVRESEERYRLLFDQAPDSIMLMDLEDPARPVIIDANQATATMHGMTRDEIIGMSIAYLDSPHERKKVEGRARRIQAGEVVSFETEHLRKDGSRFPVEVFAHLVEINGKPTIQAIDRDISERRRAEEEKRTLEAQLQQAQKMEAMGSMAAGLAHEIKNPLAGIQGTLELLRDEAEDEVKDLYDQMLAELKRVNETIHSLLGFARPRKPKRVNVDMMTLLEDTVRLLRPGFEQRGISVDVSVAPEVGTFRLDRDQIRQVLLNLVNNAADAIDRNGHIDVRALGAPVEGGLVITVQDDGPGVAEENLDRVFEPFFTTRFSGTGLGLAMARSLVEQHGGRLEVSSQLGSGTTFSILLPDMQPSTEPAPGGEV
jgi:PAS domain S-box-containing protein